MKGNRNKKDGLWDTPIPYEIVHKRTIQESNYKTPPSHTAMYISSSTSTHKTPTTTSSPRRQKAVHLQMNLQEWKIYVI